MASKERVYETEKHRLVIHQTEEREGKDYVVTLFGKPRPVSAESVSQTQSIELYRGKFTPAHNIFTQVSNIIEFGAIERDVDVREGVQAAIPSGPSGRIQRV